MKMCQEWEAWAEIIPCGARVHLRGKTAAHYQEGVRKVVFMVQTEQTGLSTSLLLLSNASILCVLPLCWNAFAGSEAEQRFLKERVFYHLKNDKHTDYVFETDC